MARHPSSSSSSSTLRMTLPVATTVLVALCSAPWASAGADTGGPAARTPHKLGDHPAIVVQRLQRQAGYDYAAHFYLHPAMLYLRSEPPREDADDAAAAKDTEGAALSLVRAGARALQRDGQSIE